MGMGMHNDLLQAVPASDRLKLLPAPQLPATFMRLTSTEPTVLAP
jgi:hypothetical protein